MTRKPPTVQQIIEFDRNSDTAAHKILEIMDELNLREQVFTLALVNQAMNHHFELTANKLDFLRIAGGDKS